MLNFFFETLEILKYPIIGLFITFSVLSFYWVRIFKFFNLREYNNIQRVHQNEVPRFGGFTIYIFLWCLLLFRIINEPFVFNLLIASIPFVIISFKEDLFHNTSPKIRLISMIFGCLIFFYINPIKFPIIEIPYIGEVIGIYPVSIVFFTFSALVVMNGMNLIDGMHGLFGLTAFLQLVALGFIAYHLNNFQFLNIVIICLIPLLIFLFFNFPFGKIFIGDLGAYFYGFINALLTIYLFGNHTNLLSWLAVLILFYPCMELLFSYYRKIKNNKSPFDADNKHLHSLLNKKFFFKLKNKSLGNSLSTISLFIFWLVPIVIAINFEKNIYIVSLSLICLSCFYIYLYHCKNKS